MTVITGAFEYAFLNVPSLSSLAREQCGCMPVNYMEHIIMF